MLNKYAIANEAEKEKSGDKAGAKTGGSQMPSSDKLIFSRILGHFEIPQSHNWIESRDCWVCEKHTYTLILASKSIA
jgi:hypothetical protein